MELTAAGTVQDFHLIPFWLVPDMGLAHHCGAKINKNRFEVQGVYKKLINGVDIVYMDIQLKVVYILCKSGYPGKSYLETVHNVLLTPP